MRQVRRIRPLAFLAATIVAVCFAYGHGGRVVAASNAPAKQTVARPSDHRLEAQAKADARSATSPAPESSAIVPRGRAYLFRGALGPIFSRGMDKLADDIERAGVPADVYEFTLCGLVRAKVLKEYRKDPAPIILIGHSMGGRCGLQIAEALQDLNIPISLLVTIDPAHLSPDVPLNVERFMNIYLSKDILGGGNIVPAQGFQGHYVSYDLSKTKVLHINIDKMDAVHRQLIEKVVQLSVTPAKTETDPVPLRYVIPPNAEIELWDSGMMVSARPQDTLQTIAAQYHLPLWSLTQVNPTPENAPLIPGQRVILPRHLTPPAVVSETLPPR